MAISPWSMKVAFMQLRGGENKNETERGVIHFHPNRAGSGVLPCFYYHAVVIGECGFSLSVSFFFSIFAAKRKLYECYEQSKQ